MTELPMQVRADDEPGTALCFVTATVDGIAEEFLLDTGGSRSRVRASGRTAGWLIEDDDRSGRGVHGPAGRVLRARVPAIAFGPITVRDVVVDVSTDDAHGESALLGLDVLHGHRLDMLPASGVCRIDADEPVDAVWPLVTSSRHHPMLDVAWDEASARAVWDTGASITIVDTGFAAAHPGLFVPLGESSGTDAHGSTADTPLVTMAACRIGGRVFAPSPAATAPIAGLARPGDPAFELIVGYPIIAQANWATDLRAGAWGFLPD
ncbi:hypothetical protein GCM10022240_16620 [Microbacterium kribbense]|uniref:Peptidase A2 domain-containing protein n=1 Tax=Microbacterium kribbense TaxID=433645 RepID=A0ABP7GJT1_9MICO